jgi:acyl-CoA thioester hydrolase
MADLLAEFPVIVPHRVLWGEMDAYRHVNNTVYFRWFESARIAYFERMAVIGSYGGVGPILASTSCRFRAAVKYPDEIRAGARVAKLDEDRFTMAFAVASAALGRIVAEGEGVIVPFDYAAQKKVALPAAWREAIEKLEKR